jgi:diguanylate cyclase (GGDEF)-like protein
MAFWTTRRAPTLRTPILVLILLAFALVSVPAYWGFTTLVGTMVTQLGTLFAEKQVLFDRYRGLDALKEEVGLAETLTRSPVIDDWARDELDPKKRARAIAQLEQFRRSFAGHSYFFVVGGSGNYYYNDAESTRPADQPAYRVSRDDPRDRWYFSTVALGEGCHLNVDHNDQIAVTKVWINCLIRDGTQVLGVLGTGIDLSDFIREVVNYPQPGVQSIFVDASGAIQAHADPRYIDFHSLTNAIDTRKTVFNLLDRPDDRAELRRMMREVTEPDVAVRSQFLSIDGRPTLVGVGYLDGLGWYNVTLMDIDRIIDRSLFMPIGLLIVAVVIAVAVIIVLLFKLLVLDRIARVEAGVVAVHRGEWSPVPADPRNDEIGRLSQTISAMANTVQDNLKMLEDMVEERTAELQELAYRDQLTGIANRRGFADAFERAMATDAAGIRRALLLIDVDSFKQINDRFGHHAGDEVAIEVTRRLATVLRPADLCGRWGGDEFIVLFADLGGRPLRAIAEAVQRGLSTPVALRDVGEVTVTVSVGACLVEPGESLDYVADLADRALYRAKESGRNRVMLHDPTATRPSAPPVQ